MGLLESRIENWKADLTQVLAWLEKGTEASIKRSKAHVRAMIGDMTKIVSGLKAKEKPRTFEDGIRYIQSKGDKGIGSWLALLDEKENLLKMTRVSKEMLEPYKVEVHEEPIRVTMTKRTLVIPQLEDFTRNISGKVKKFEWVFNDGTTITRGSHSPKKGKTK